VPVVAGVCGGGGRDGGAVEIGRAVGGGVY